MEKPGDVELLQLFLAQSDHLCPRCAYNLRGLRGQTCPECGEVLILRVGLVHPKLAALITGLVGLAAGAGLNGLLLIFGAIRLSIDGYSGFMSTFFIYNGMGLLVEGGALLAWLLGWRWIHTLPEVSRWALAATCWALSLMNIIAFSMIIR